MRVLLVGGDIGTRAAVERLTEGSGHHLEWRKTASRVDFEVNNCDLLLVDGAALWRDEAQRLRTYLAMQAGSGGGAVFCFDPALDPRAETNTPGRLPYRGECGVQQTAEGYCVMRCRFHEQALKDFRARGRDERSRPVGRAMVFEYQGEAGESPSPNMEEIPEDFI